MPISYRPKIAGFSTEKPMELQPERQLWKLKRSDFIHAAAALGYRCMPLKCQGVFCELINTSEMNLET